MGYYHIRLDADASKLCTIVLPWGKYEYLRLRMGVASSVDIFQEKMSKLMCGLEFVRVYIDDLLLLTMDNFEDHLHKMDLVLQQLQEAGLKVNAEKSFFGRTETDYLRFHVCRKGIRPLNHKVSAILNIAPPTTIKKIRSFVGMVNFYKQMWIHRSHVLAPLTKL